MHYNDLSNSDEVRIEIEMPDPQTIIDYHFRDIMLTNDPVEIYEIISSLYKEAYIHGTEQGIYSAIQLNSELLRALSESI